MKSPLKLLSIVGILCFVVDLTCGAQEKTADLLNPSQPFYSDVSGHHALGSATAPTVEEAERLAKAAALQRCFREIGKDALFQSLFISSWPDAIAVEARRAEKAKEGGMTVLLRVRVDGNAVIMTETQYRNTATDLLNRGEKLVGELEKSLADATADETNLQIAQALTEYRNARSRIREIGVLLKAMGDESQVSESGKSLAALRQTVKALEERVSAGMDRIESIEKKTEKDAATEEMADALELLSAEIEKIGLDVEKQEALSPFYDLPRAQLEPIVIGLKNGQDKMKLVTEKLAFMKGKVPADRVLMEQKVQMALADAAELEAKLKSLKEAADLELRNPRLARQESARFWSEVGKGSLGALSYAFLHKPADVVSLRYDLPFAWDGEHAIGGTMEQDFRLQAEGAFPFGFWIRGQLANSETALVSDAATGSRAVNTALYSEADLGYFRGILFAAGFGWDWTHGIIPAGSTVSQKTAKESYVRVMLGGANQEGTRIDWLLSLKYRFPLFADPFLVPYHFNVGLDYMLRAADILLLEAGVSTGCLQDTAVETVSLIKPEDLTYAFSWRFAVALRVPGPFAWGIMHQGELLAPLDSLGNLGTGNGYVGEWGLFAEYDF